MVNSTASYGVYGSSGSGYGVFGVSVNSDGVVAGSGGAGTSGLLAYASGPTAYAATFNGQVLVYQSLSGNAQTANTDSIYGSGNSAGYGGVHGSSTVTGAVGVYGTASGGAYAGVFTGTTQVNGSFTVYGGPKSAAVPHPDGTHRLLYCLESPEAWFEDFGEVSLVGGTATVALDGDFAAVVETSKLHVFLTSHVAGNALAVTARSATGFTVTEGGAGKSSGGFTYRVVAKRKDISAPRLAKATLAPVPAHPTPPTFPPPPAIPATPAFATVLTPTIATPARPPAVPDPPGLLTKQTGTAPAAAAVLGGDESAPLVAAIARD
ncbi:MAG: hypothetical protein ACYDAR_10020 [Thermomicrobiales bacterium]